MKPLVSVIISNRNDTVMLTVTVRSCLEELRALGPGMGEVVICDNSDKATYDLLPNVLPTGYMKDGTLRLLRQDFPCLFTAREAAIREAKGDYVICLDSHMLLGHNLIDDLVRSIIERSDDPTLGFLHAPISWIHQHEQYARHDRDMTKHELGDWGKAYKTARTITWKGMPWICRRKWFLDSEKGLGGYGALSQHRLSWGGGDMHIGVKPWLLGFKNWAIPTNPAFHIGPFPKIDWTERSEVTNVYSNSSDYHYRLWSESGQGPSAIGFLVSCYVLGGEPMMLRNKGILKERFGSFIDVEKHWNTIKDIGKDEKAWLDSRKKMTIEQLLATKPWDAA